MTNTRKASMLAPALTSAAMILAGCSSGQRTGSLNQAVSDYDGQRYVQSYAGAKALTGSRTASTRAQASYLAGLSAYKLDQRDDAERYLLMAAGSGETTVVPQANAMLGVIRLDQKREREAVVLLEKAQPSLSSDDARHAAEQLAYANQQLGNTSEAKRWIARADRATGTDSTFRSTTSSSASSSDRVSGELFALQVGAFRSKDHAESAAAVAQRQATKLGLGPMRIVPSRDDRGLTLFLVQFGKFPTRSSAATTRDRLGRLEYIVAPLAMPST